MTTKDETPLTFNQTAIAHAKELDDLRSRLAQAEAERANWEADAFRRAQNEQHWQDKFRESETALVRAKAELQRVRADAERYRWLREQDWEKARLCVIVNPKGNAKLGTDCPSRDRLDAAIDAMQSAPPTTSSTEAGK